MKKIILTFAFLLIPALGFSQNNETAKSKPEILKLDLNASSVAWVGKKVTGKHNGTLKLKSGQIEVENNKVLRGEFVLDMTSISVEDIKDPEKNLKLKSHLMSDDFFGVKNFPEASFKMGDVKQEKPGEIKVVGNLLLKGILQPMSFPAKIEWVENGVKAKATVEIDRTLHNIRYGSGKFFDNLGDKMISDKFEVILDLVAKK